MGLTLNITEKQRTLRDDYKIKASASIAQCAEQIIRRSYVFLNCFSLFSPFFHGSFEFPILLFQHFTHCVAFT